MYTQYVDFVVKFDPEKETEAELMHKIIYALILRRIKFKKPCVTHITAMSGEGKSETALFFIYSILRAQGIDIKEHMEITNIFNQAEYAQKLKSHLMDKQYKKVNCLAVHEGRESMEAAEWQSVFNRNVAHVNALSRSLKRMAIFIISQNIRDVTKSVRYTLNYQIKLYRRMVYGVQGQVRFIWYVLYNDDRDLDNPRIRKRRVKGQIILPSGKRRSYSPKYFSIPRLPKEITKLFEEMDAEKKRAILIGKLEEMEHEAQKGKGEAKKIQKVVEFYANNPEAMRRHIKFNKRGGVMVDKDFMDLHSLAPSEGKEFKKKMQEVLENGAGQI